MRNLRKRSKALFIGRFQPFHKGHLFMLRRILKEFDEVIIGIGSAQYSHTDQNPFTAGERFSMITAVLKKEGIRECHIVPIEDLGIHSLWVPYVRTLVPDFDAVVTNDPLTIRLFREAGHKVKEFPLERRIEFSGTEIRRRILAGEDWRELVPAEVSKIVEEIGGVSRIKDLAMS